MMVTVNSSCRRLPVISSAVVCILLATVPASYGLTDEPEEEDEEGAGAAARSEGSPRKLLTDEEHEECLRPPEECSHKYAQDYVKANPYDARRKENLRPRISDDYVLPGDDEAVCTDGFQACKEKLAEHCREHRQNVCPPIRTPADLFPPGVPHPDAQPHDPPNYYKPPWERGMDDPEKIQVLEKFRAHIGAQHAMGWEYPGLPP